MKNSIWGFLLLGSLASCSRPEPVLPVNAGFVHVEIPIREQGFELQTRLADENSVRDVNYYLVNPAYKEVMHGYQQSDLLRFECLPGVYDLYVLANIHSDLGQMTVAELRSLKLDYRYQYDDLPMWTKTTLTIPAQKNNSSFRPVVNVKRGLAKVAVNVRSVVHDIVLKSIRVVNIPRFSRPFAQNDPPSPQRSDYNQTEVTLITGQADTYSAVYYLPENMQGERTDIASQQLKGPPKAPKYASYILIRAEKDGQVLAYRIYLGSNNTTNFDLKRNTCYTVDIQVKGTDETDTRVSSYVVSMGTNFLSDACGDYFIPGSSRMLHVNIIGENTSRLRGNVVLGSGAAEDFSFDGQHGKSEYNFALRVLNGENKFNLCYTPSVITRNNALLEFDVLVEDEGGIQLCDHNQYRFANVVDIHRSTTQGSITATGALYSKLTADGTMRVMCYDDGCTLHAVADAGAFFEGWYADPTYEKLLSAKDSYTYKPSVSIGSLYAGFGTGEALDNTGTANCYIAPKRNTYYSFNATVRGNNKATTNIGTGTLTGSQAKVIWETGSNVGDVISSVSYGSGRILFRTGKFEGNALVGLFDPNGKCIWSWHIWATDYDPQATQQQYSDGSIFMDRNVGSMSVNHMHYTSRGLYYQWGRKDPFLYPAGILSRIPLKAVYQNGFEHDSYSKAVTVSYTIEHPTTFIDSSSDWQYGIVAQINLWGNTSKSTSALTDTGSKSIYDPCPAGWRVPDRRTWEKAGMKIKTINGSYYFLCDTGNGETFFPMSGFYYFSDYPNCGSWSYAWTNAPTANGATGLMLQNGAVYPTENMRRYYAAPVRCMKE